MSYTTTTGVAAFGQVAVMGMELSNYVELSTLALDLNYMKGYEALRESAAWIDLSVRGTIRVNGDDRARLLHAITTNHIHQLRPGTGCYAFFLDAQGRVLADANILCREDHFLLDTEPETRERIFGHLDHYIIADDVTLEDTTARTTSIAVEGPRSAEVLARIGASVPEADYAFVPWGSRLVARLNSTGSPGFFVFAPVDQKPALIAQLGIEQADAEAARIVRLEHGKPRYSEDITHRFLAQETNQSHALHFNKGCYLGQEIVERVRTRGLLHRRLMAVDIHGTTAPAPGTRLTAKGKVAAEVTSAAFSPALARVVALAYVRTEFAQSGSTVDCGDLQATVR